MVTMEQLLQSMTPYGQLCKTADIKVLEMALPMIAIGRRDRAHTRITGLEMLPAGDQYIALKPSCLYFMAKEAIMASGKGGSDEQEAKTSEIMSRFADRIYGGRLEGPTFHLEPLNGKVDPNDTHMLIIRNSDLISILRHAVRSVFYGASTSNRNWCSGF